MLNDCNVFQRSLILTNSWVCGENLKQNDCNVFQRSLILTNSWVCGENLKKNLDYLLFWKQNPGPETTKHTRHNMERISFTEYELSITCISKETTIYTCRLGDPSDETTIYTCRLGDPSFIHSFICLRHTSHRIHTKVNNTLRWTDMAVVIVFDGEWH